LVRTFSALFVNEFFRIVNIAKPPLTANRRVVTHFGDEGQDHMIQSARSTSPRAPSPYRGDAIIKRSHDHTT
jgi:hypothetical protein